MIGEHEGYFAPAEFEVGGKLIAGKNTLVVKVWSPFDDKLVSMKQFGMEIGPMFRFLASEKNMMKGTYDHADGFIQRDVNPVGIYGNVALSFYEDARLDGEPNIIAQLDQGKAELKASAPVFSPAEGTVRYSMAVLHPQTGEAVVTRSGSAKLPAGHSELTESFSLDSPLLWTLWDRGSANLYTLRICLNGMEVPIERKFGIRTVSMIRSSDTTAFIVNGQRVFLRGTSYFPDVYLSQMTRERYESDLRRIKALGFNAVRVHVHVARPAFYELCDQLGLAVVQDSDISWFHSDTDDFISRAVGIFGDMVRMLRPHPSIICWVAMNEPDMWVVAEKRGWIKLDEKPVSMMGDRPGPQFIALLRELDPKRPYIKGSQFADDMESGDEHNYIGSISGEDSHYFDNYDKRFKLLTEFGMDMPGSAEKLRNIPKYYKRIAALYDNSDAFEKLKEYRRRYLKYMTEHCRIQKGAPCGGYFQFLFSDVCPQSFYGLQDWWGTLKAGADYCFESNQPIGIFLEHSKGKSSGIWAANDTPQRIKDCTARWCVTDEMGSAVISGEAVVSIAADGLIRIGELNIASDAASAYNVSLILLGEDGTEIAANRYTDVFRNIEHPKGHPMRIDHELGMRLFWA